MERNFFKNIFNIKVHKKLSFQVFRSCSSVLYSTELYTLRKVSVKKFKVHLKLYKITYFNMISIPLTETF